MRVAILTHVKASAIAGSLGGPVGAVLYVVAGAVASLAGGTPRELSDAVVVALYIAFLGLWLGIAVGVVIGTPVLALLSFAGLNRPVFAAVAGAAIGAVVGTMLEPPRAHVVWPALFACVGAFCGAAASYICALTTSSSGPPTAAAHGER